MCTLEHGVLVERQARIHFGGNAARNHIEDFLAHGDAETVAGQAHVALAVADASVQQLGVSRDGGGFEQQGRVGGGVDRLDPGDRFEVAGVGNHGGHLFELFQLGSHGCALSCGFDDITRALTATQGHQGVTGSPGATT